MPYAYLSDPSLCFDAWIVRKLATDDFTQDGWSYQDNVNYGADANSPVLRSTPHGPPKWEITDVEEPDNAAGLFLMYST